MNGSERAECVAYVDDFGLAVVESWFFPSPSRYYDPYQYAREICAACSMRAECLQHAIDNRIYYGMYGGLDPTERAAITGVNHRTHVGPLKWCPTCKLDHPTGDFAVNRSRTTGRHGECRRCQRTRDNTKAETA